MKRAYREALSRDMNVYFLFLSGSEELIRQRLSERKGHFMPPALLPSQFEILEPLSSDENGVKISIEGSADDVARRAVEAVRAYEKAQRQVISGR